MPDRDDPMTTSAEPDAARPQPAPDSLPSSCTTTQGGTSVHVPPPPTRVPPIDSLALDRRPLPRPRPSPGCHHVQVGRHRPGRHRGRARVYDEAVAQRVGKMVEW